MDVKEARTTIAKKYLTDAKFREELKKNPNAAIESLLGLKLPAGMKIELVLDTPAKTHLVLPEVPAGKELTEADLGNVAGGIGGLCGILTKDEPQPRPGGGGGGPARCNSTAN